MSNRAQVIPVDDGAYWRVVFGGSKGNILDRTMLTALAGVFREAGEDRRLKAVCLEGEGAHFSFGASVKEHLPDEVEDMLETLRELAMAMLDSSVVIIAAVRGQCLGGGLEVATLCHRIIASRDAMFGQPEIQLGVFAPLASVMLPERISRANAEDLCLTGRSITAAEAHGMGLVDTIADGSPSDAAIDWARQHFAAKSASSLRLAVRAIRSSVAAKVRTELPALERLYLGELMHSADAVEGLHAFIEKRAAVWRHA